MNIDTIVDFDIEPISVSINVRNGVTGSLGDPATERPDKKSQMYFTPSLNS